MNLLSKMVISPALLVAFHAFSADMTIKPPVSDKHNVVVPDQQVKLPTAAPLSDAELEKLPAAYWRENPSALESVLSKYVVMGDAEGLKKYLPYYRDVPNRDPSLIEWGDAIIAARAGDFKTAIRLYRKINSLLPNVTLVRFQLAMALYADKQYVAAEHELEKLRAEQLPEQYAQAVDHVLKMIHRQEQWDFYASATYSYDKNVNEAPPVGTKMVFPNGSSITSQQEPRSANGVEFDFSADKRWNLRGNYFAALHLSTFGKLYWDEKTSNDLSSRIGIGGGYSNAVTEIELSPFFSHRWYVNRDDNNSNFDHYNTGYGLRLSGSQWLSTKFKYQGALEWTQNRYRSDYRHLNGNDYLMSHTLMYLPAARYYWFGGIDYSIRDVESKTNSYDRWGARLGWGQEWGKGFATRTTIGYGRKTFDDVDFFNIKQKNNEYSASVSLWNRNFYFGGITPRLTWSYRKVDGNHPFYNYDKQNVVVEFSKTF